METAATPHSYERNRLTPTKKPAKVEKNNKNNGKNAAILRAKITLMETMKKQRIIVLPKNRKTPKNAKK